VTDRSHLGAWLVAVEVDPRNLTSGENMKASFPTAALAVAASAVALTATAAVPAVAGTKQPAGQATTASRGPSRHTVVQERCAGTGIAPSGVCWMVLLPHLTISTGPALWMAHTHWSHWGRSYATGRGTLHACDFGCWTDRHISIRLYRPTGGIAIAGRKHPYFSRLHLGHPRGVNAYWHWSTRFHTWIGGR